MNDKSPPGSPAIDSILKLSLAEKLTITQSDDVNIRPLGSGNKAGNRQKLFKKSRTKLDYWREWGTDKKTTDEDLVWATNYLSSRIQFGGLHYDDDKPRTIFLTNLFNLFRDVNWASLTSEEMANVLDVFDGLGSTKRSNDHYQKHGKKQLRLTVTKADKALIREYTERKGVASQKSAILEILGDYKAAQNQADSLRAKCEELTNQITTLEEDKSDLHSQAQDLSERATELLKKKEQLEEELATEKERSGQLETDIVTLKEQIEELNRARTPKEHSSQSPNPAAATIAEDEPASGNQHAETPERCEDSEAYIVIDEDEPTPDSSPPTDDYRNDSGGAQARRTAAAPPQATGDQEGGDQQLASTQSMIACLDLMLELVKSHPGENEDEPWPPRDSSKHADYSDRKKRLDKKNELRQLLNQLCDIHREESSHQDGLVWDQIRSLDADILNLSNLLYGFQTNDLRQWDSELIGLGDTIRRIKEELTSE